MWWRDAVALARLRPGAAALALAVLLLAGCGFRPLYAPAETATTDPRLASIQVAQIPDRIGQRLTIALRDSFNPGGAAIEPRYRLLVSLSTTRREVAIRRDGTASRAEIAVRAGYQLVDLDDGKVAMAGSARSSSSVDLVVNEYANLVAEEDARTRAVEDIALEIQTRCAMFFERPATAAR
jgi:LPS-assembly lipoprotein